MLRISGAPCRALRRQYAFGVIRSTKQRPFPKVTFATWKSGWARARQTCLKLISVHSVAKETLSHVAGHATKPVRMEVEQDPSMLPNQLNCFAVVLKATSGVFEDSQYR